MSRTAESTSKGLEQRLTCERRNLERKTAVLAALPPNAPAPYMVLGSAYRADAGLKYQDQTRGSVGALLEALPPVPLARVHASGTISFYPLGKVSNREHEEGEVWHLAPFIWHIEHFYGPNTGGASVVWWTWLGDFLVRVCASLPQDRARLVADHERNEKRRIIRHRWNLELPGFAPGYDVTSYASGSPVVPGQRVVFWTDPSTEWADIFEEVGT